MKRVLWMAGLAWVAVAGAQTEVSRPPAEVMEPSYLAEVTQHLYRWYMDEADVEREAGAEHLVFWVRRLEVGRDEGDRSEWGEIVLPQMGIGVRVKKADYAIEERGVEVKSAGFRIVNVWREAAPAEPPPGAEVIRMDYRQMKEQLFEKRAEARFPDEAMFERLRVAVRDYYHLDPADTRPRERVIHVAPLSPVANELWVFLETRKILIRFASDIDLEDPAMWEHQALGIRSYDILKQTVVSMNEAAGSNEFLTRDQVGRALYNCVVLGRRIEGANPE
ncbi:MAG TPA: hypothetical protein PK388_06810 [Kiritimatiellia bacterium]|nr:hypothetical protein [Kiritimatiellia bacterium]